MNVGTHRQIADFIWGICNLLRGPYKRNEYRKVAVGDFGPVRVPDAVAVALHPVLVSADAGVAGVGPAQRDVAVGGSGGEAGRRIRRRRLGVAMALADGPALS